MDKIFLMSDKLQVIKPIVGLVQVLMVYLQTGRNFAVKCFPHHSVDKFFGVLTVFAKVRYAVTVVNRRVFQRPMFFIARPSFALLNRHNGSDASTKKRGHFFKFSAIGQHMFSLLNLFCGKKFAPRNAPRVSKVANFIQIFKPKHWFPNFHVSLRKRFNYFTPELIGRQT